MDSDKMGIVLGWIERGPYEVMESARSMDVKLIGILAAASVLFGVMPTLAFNSEATQFRLDWYLLSLALAVVAYLTIFGVTLWQIWPRRYWLPSDLNFVEQYLKATQERAREIHLAVIRRATERNNGILQSKARWLMVNTFLLGLETVTLLSWLVAPSILKLAY